MKPKQYLVSIGALQTAGKGRLSAEHKKLCADAAASGMFIEGFSSTSRKATNAEPKSESTGIVDIGPELRPERENEAFTSTGPVGMKTVCDNCHSSLTYCPCRFPVVSWHGKPEMVQFKKRTHSLPVYPWS